MKRMVLVSALAIGALLAGALAMIDRAMRDPPGAPVPAAAGELSPPRVAVEPAPAPPPPTIPPDEPAAAPRGHAPEAEEEIARRQRESELLLEELEQTILRSETARRCVKSASAIGAYLHLALEGTDPLRSRPIALDSSGITYRFDETVDPEVSYCLMMEAMPEVLASTSVKGGARRAERSVRIPPY